MATEEMDDKEVRRGSDESSGSGHGVHALPWSALSITLLPVGNISAGMEFCAVAGCFSSCSGGEDLSLPKIETN